jgi:hypothetical protein
MAGGGLEIIKLPEANPQADTASSLGGGLQGGGEAGTKGDSRPWPIRLIPFKFLALSRPARLRPIPESISLRGSSSSNSRGSGGRDSFHSWGN